MATMELAMFPSSPFHNCAYHKSTNESHIHVGYVQHTAPASALQLNNVNTLPGETLLQEGLDEPGIPVDYNTYASLLQSCSNVEALKQTHARMFRCGLYQNIFLETKLMNMYATFGSMENARLVFDKLYNPDVLLWNSIFRGYVKNGFYDETLAFYSLLQRSGQPSQVPRWESQGNNTNSPVGSNVEAYASLLQACTNVMGLKQVQACILINGLDQNIFLGTKLVTMYAMFASLKYARLVFDKICKRNVLLWNAMIREYAKSGQCEETLALYHQMQQEGIQPDHFTFPFVLKACAGLSALQEGKEIHYHIVKTGSESNVFVGATLIDMYVKCGSIEYARQVFDKMSTRDLVSWTAIIAGYVVNENPKEALALFDRMQMEKVTPDSITMVSVISACAHLGALQQGKWIHDYAERCGFVCDVSVANSLVAMYAKFGSIEIARQLFDKMSKRDVVSWNGMIAGYAQNGHANEALTLFHQMQLAYVKPDSVTIASVLSACANLGALQQGMWIHDYVIRSGFESDVSVGNSLIAMYAKCRSIKVARELFDKMSKRDVISWNAMIAGYAQNGHAAEALTLFNQMQLTNVKPNLVTVKCALSACAHLAALQQGKWIHNYIIRSRFESDVCVRNSLIDMYAKCGSIKIARQLFDKMSKRDAVSWNAMIAGYGMHGHGEYIPHKQDDKVTS